MKLRLRILFIVLLFFGSLLYVVPWDTLGIPMPFQTSPYRLGLDLHGGVELDYTVDLENIKTMSGGDAVQENSIIEGVKSIIEKRVNSLGLAEPTIQTARYGKEAHIIVQIPTQDYRNISEEEKKEKSEADIAKAKSTIGKVVKLEFREQKTTITEADRLERKALALAARKEIDAGIPFETVGIKYRDQFEMVGYESASGALPPQATFSGVESIQKFPYISPVVETAFPGQLSTDGSGNAVTLTGMAGYTIVKIDSIETVKGFSGMAEKIYHYSYIFVSEQPSEWMPAKTEDGKILNDRYLNSSTVAFSQLGAPEVQLNFNAEGAKIFAELTKRLVGKPIAIFVGGELITAPTVNAMIPDGRAVITGKYSVEEAQKLANDITTGIVPAPIYLTSERMIDAKIGADSLRLLMQAGLIGLIVIILFLISIYRVSGFLAGLALIVYGLILVALVKFFSVVLTLASIAGIVLSIGLAIDANILIFERMKESLRKGDALDRATAIGFDRSWSAIWDSHITSLTSAIILYVFGISLIKGFGLMLGLGIVLSLFTAMWVSRILIIAIGRYFSHNTRAFIGVDNGKR